MRATFMAMLSTVVCGSAARAEIIHFVNPAPGEEGHYDWRWEPAAGWQSWLDITRGPTGQPNVLNGDSVGQLVVPFAPGANLTSSWPGIAAADVTVDWENYTQLLTLALSYGAPLEGRAYLSQSHHFNPGMFPGEPHSLFPEGQRTYIGVRTSSFRYGWIEVVRTGPSLTALSWAYETEPGVPMLAGQIPAPGTTVLITLGALGLSANRRRSCGVPA